MARIVYNMDREWRFHRGELEQEQKNSHSASYASSKSGAADGAASTQFADGDWRLLDLPHDYFAESEFSKNNLLSHGYRDRCNAWYRKTFALSTDLIGKQLLLCFDGTAVNAEFYFNGSLLERSFSAYTETFFDVTDRARCEPGEYNVLAVHIRGMETEGWWYEGAGIYRHVRLYAKDSLHIAHNGIYGKPVLKPGTKNSWTVEVQTEVENSDYDTAQTAIVHAALYDGETLVAQSTAAPAVCPFTSVTPVKQKLSVSRPTRWDVDHPQLYTLRVSVEKNGQIVDEDTVRIGFRTFHIDAEKGFFLNDRPLKIKGTCNHQDHAGVGVAVPDSVQYYRIRRLKEMGCNAYRCSHNLPAREILDACDELGLIVMDENRRFETREEVLHYLDIMVKRDRNHPSVIFWSLFNEEPLQNTDEGARIYRRMKSRVLHLDDTRLLTGAINGTMAGAGMYMDVTGINYAIHSIAAYHAQNPTQPMIGSENNSAVTTRGCYETDMEQYQLTSFDEKAVPWGQTVRQTWDFARKNDYFAGIFIWTGFDYRGEPTPFQWPAVSSSFGIMDTCGFPKSSYYYNQACFMEKPVVHIIPHWNWKKGETVRVATPTNCDEVELFLNGHSLGRKTGDCIQTPEWQVPFAPGRLIARGYRNGRCVARDEQRTAGRPYAIRICPDRTTAHNDGQDTLVLNICAVDRRGVVVPDCDTLLHFSVEGDGYVRGVGNGNHISHESDVLPMRQLYHGWCQALVTVHPGAKALTFTATGKGLQPATFAPQIEDAPAPLYMRNASASMTAFLTMSEITPERQDPLRTFADNDMNSMILVSPYTHQGDFHTGWRLYRVVVRMPEQGNGHYIMVFPNLIADEAEIYANGKQIYLSREPFNGQTGSGVLCIPFQAEPGEEIDFRILLRMLDAPWGGIRDGVKFALDQNQA